MAEQRPTLDFWEITNLRRVELGKKWKDVLAETELSHETLNRWRKGHKVDPLTDRAFERALLWESGARGAAAAGRMPTPLTAEAAPRASAPSDGTSPQLSSRELDILADMAESMAERLGLSPEEMDEALRRARERIARRRAARDLPNNDSESPNLRTG